MRHRPGFSSANIHVSTDGTRVVNYAQWDSAEAYAAMLADSEARVHMEEAAALASSFDPHLYTVESVHENVYFLARYVNSAAVTSSAPSVNVLRKSDSSNSFTLDGPS